MKLENVSQKAWPRHGEERRKVSAENMGHAELQMSVRFLQKRQVVLKASLAFPFLDFQLHARQVGGCAKAVAVVEPDIVVGFAFQYFDALRLDGCAQIAKDLFKEARKE